VTASLITHEMYYAIRLPNRRLWDGKGSSEGCDPRFRDIECADGVARMWFSCSDAENQLRELRGHAERLGTAEVFGRAEVVPFKLTLTIAEVDRDADEADTVVTEPVVPKRWNNAEDVDEGAWFRVPGAQRGDVEVIWQRRGSAAVSVNVTAYPWKVGQVADYYAEKGGLIEVLDSAVPCLDCAGVGLGKLGNCSRCYGGGEVSR
jgi:hypothetical protein